MKQKHMAYTSIYDYYDYRNGAEKRKKKEENLFFSVFLDFIQAY